MTPNAAIQVALGVGVNRGNLKKIRLDSQGNQEFINHGSGLCVVDAVSLRINCRIAARWAKMTSGTRHDGNRLKGK